jgi:hypothetical protein
MCTIDIEDSENMCMKNTFIVFLVPAVCVCDTKRRSLLRSTV